MRAEDVPKSPRLYSTLASATSDRHFAALRARRHHNLMRASPTDQSANARAVPRSRPGSPLCSAVPDWVVLDTNVLLDLLVFGDARARLLGLALADGRLRALATAPMLDELADVLLRPFVAPWCSDVGAVLDRARALCHLVEGVPVTPTPAPRCADPDDQKFIDLAWAWPTAWLFSRDRTLLALARPALRRQLRVLTPAAWAEEQAASTEQA